MQNSLRGIINKIIVLHAGTGKGGSPRSFTPPAAALEPAPLSKLLWACVALGHHRRVATPPSSPGRAHTAISNEGIMEEDVRTQQVVSELFVWATSHLLPYPEGGGGGAKASLHAKEAVRMAAALAEASVPSAQGSPTSPATSTSPNVGRTIEELTKAVLRKRFELT